MFGGKANRPGSIAIGSSETLSDNPDFPNGGSGRGIAIGLGAKVQAQDAISIGHETFAKKGAHWSFASGTFTETTNQDEYATGSINQSFPGVAFSIGNGYYDYRSGSYRRVGVNALVVMRGSTSGYFANDGNLGGGSKIGINMPFNANDSNDYSQSAPTEILDVNGNIRSRTISTNAGANTDKVVVTNSQGVLKSVDRSAFASPYTAGEGITITNNMIAQTGLKKNGKGYSLIGNTTYNRLVLGENAIDLSSYAFPANGPSSPYYTIGASGTNSIVTGNNTLSTGGASFSGGAYNIAESYASFYIGSSGTIDNAGEPNNWGYNKKRIFNIGNGWTGINSDAFTVLRNGTAGINIDELFNTSSDAKLQVNGKVLIGDFGGYNFNVSSQPNTISTAPNSDASLNVLGEVKIGSKNITCNATNEGSIRYVKTAGVGNFEGCRDNNGTFGWIRINP